MGEHPAALWVVLRGAVETRMRGAEASRLLRLAGPSRAVGHSGLLASDAFVGRIESRARERSVLVEVSGPRVHELLADDSPGPRRFAAALWTDVVRALQQGQRPLAGTRRTSASRRVPALLLAELHVRSETGLGAKRARVAA